LNTKTDGLYERSPTCHVVETQFYFLFPFPLLVYSFCPSNSSSPSALIALVFRRRWLEYSSSWNTLHCSKRNIKCSLCKASHKLDKKGPENFGKDNTRRDLLLFLRENANENGTLKKRSNISWVHYHDLLIHIVLQIHPRHQPWSF
jgi:hypothetical protein